MTGHQAGQSFIIECSVRRSSVGQSIDNLPKNLYIYMTTANNKIWQSIQNPTEILLTGDGFWVVREGGKEKRFEIELNSTTP